MTPPQPESTVAAAPAAAAPVAAAPVAAGQIRDRHPLALALFALTVVSGLIDAVSYLGLGHVSPRT